MTIGGDILDNDGLLEGTAFQSELGRPLTAGSFNAAPRIVGRSIRGTVHRVFSKKPEDVSETDEYTGKIDPRETRLSWGDMAEGYSYKRTPIVEGVVVPEVLKFLAEVEADKGGKPLNLMDFGMGPGKMLDVLLSPNVARLIGVDNCPQMVEQARQRVAGFDGRQSGKIDLYQMYELRDLDFILGSEFLDAAFLGSVVMTLDNYRYMFRLFELLFKALTPGGKVLLTTTNVDALGTLPPLRFTDAVLAKLLLPHLENLRSNGTLISPDSPAFGWMQCVFGHKMDEGEWGSLPVLETNNRKGSGEMAFDFHNSRLLVPKPRQTGEPYLVLGKFGSRVQAFRDKHYTPWVIFKALSDAGFAVDPAMSSPHLDDGSSWAQRMQEQENGGQLTIIKATKPSAAPSSFPYVRSSSKRYGDFYPEENVTF